MEKIKGITQEVLSYLPKTWAWIAGGIAYVALFIGAAFVFNMGVNNSHNRAVASCNAAQLERELEAEKAENARLEVRVKEAEAASKKVEIRTQEKVVFKDRVVERIKEVEKQIPPDQACTVVVSDVTKEALKLISEDGETLK